MKNDEHVHEILRAGKSANIFWLTRQIMKDFTKKASGEYEKKMGSSGKSPAFFESFTRVYLQLSTWTIEVQKNSWKILKTARFRCKLDGS